MSIFLFNLLIFSALSFLTTLLLFQSIKTILRIKQLKLSALCFLLPLVKLLFDLFRFDQSNWAIAAAINPLKVQRGSRILQMSFDPFHYQSGIGFFVEGKSFTIADLIYLSLPKISFCIMLIVFIISLVRLVRYFIELLYLWKRMQLFKRYECASLQRVSVYLKNLLQLHRVKVLQGGDLACSFWHKRYYILVPRDIKCSDLEQVIAHELSHIVHHDPIKKVFFGLFQAILWWLPVKFLFRKWKLEREKICDQFALQFNRSKVAYAKLLTKFATTRSGMCTFSQEKQLVARLRFLFDKQPSQVIQILQIGIFCFFAGLIFFGKYWMF